MYHCCICIKSLKYFEVLTTQIKEDDCFQNTGMGIIILYTFLILDKRNV